jgi:hypothetical protein
VPDILVTKNNVGNPIGTVVAKEGESIADLTYSGRKAAASKYTQHGLPIKNVNGRTAPNASSLVSAEEAAIFLGINKVVARALFPSIYPRPVQNRFECPYDNKEEEEETKSIDVDQIFQLSEIAFLVELAFATAERDISEIQIKNR